MIILGIETSCDETAAAVLQKTGDRITILSNVIASSAQLQSKYGGIIPEQAAREQLKAIIPVIEETLRQAFPDYSLQPTHYKIPIDAIAVTYGPGLIGSLLVGVETAKVLSIIWNKPLIPVNHLLGHFWANWIYESPVISNQLSEKTSLKADSEAVLMADSCPQFPCVGLLVSGGHTDLVLFKDPQTYEYLGGTRDDAAGECFDKCARLLGLPYPGGPAIAECAMKCKIENVQCKIELPRPMINSKNFEFSFSGLKTAVANIIQNGQLTMDNESQKADLCASIEQAIVDVLVEKTIKAALKYQVEHIMIAGGVAANQKLVQSLQSSAFRLQPKINLHVPPPHLCTDNGAMIAARGFFLPRRQAGEKPINPLSVQAEPNLSL